VRLALLEADVHFQVVRSFIADVKEKALGQEVTKGVHPGDQLIKIVHDELVRLLGGEHKELELKGSGPHLILMVGLQGAGKTTTCGKLAARLAKEGKRPLLVPCDVYRPAAKQQLEVVGTQVNLPVFDASEFTDPVKIVEKALVQARANRHDTVIVDTAGRLHIDDVLMQELKTLKWQFEPREILFVADAMTGQDAVNSAKAFHEALGVTGLILTKMDGDARGGAALSVKQITGKPIKFIGSSEKMDGLDVFHPDRMASRILGMGDIVSLVEKIQEEVDEEEAKKLQEKMQKNQFTLEDFAKTLQQMGRMGDLGNLMSLVPGMSSMKEKIDLQEEKRQVRTIQSMISSMTPQERVNHAILTPSRKQRIAKGSGHSLNDVNQMLKQFMQMRKMMGMFNKPEKMGKLAKMFGQMGMGDFAKSMLPGINQNPNANLDMKQMKALAEAHGGQLPPEALAQLGIQTGPTVAKSSLVNRPKKDRKKEKLKRKQGKKRK
jgi:signal recognition particle subunit SRP54